MDIALCTGCFASAANSKAIARQGPHLQNGFQSACSNNIVQPVRGGGNKFVSGSCSAKVD